MRKKLVFITMALLVAVLLGGCVGSTAWPGLSASAGVVYLSNNNAVYAVNHDGKEMWNFAGEKSGFAFFNTNPKIFVTTPVITEDGLVIVASSGNDRTMYAVDPNDINPETKSPIIKWKFSDVKGHWIAAPLVVGNRLFAPNSDGKIYVLDLQDGKSVKQAIKVIEPFANSEGQPGRLWAQPLSDGERIFVTSLDHSVFAIDAVTYEVLWHEDLDGAIPGGVALGSDGMLYTGSLSKQLVKFDPLTGAHEPVYNAQGWIWGTPVASGDNLYFSDVDGYFYSYNTKEQKLNWEQVKPDSAITGSPLVLADRVLLATESGNIYSVNNEGKVVLWHGSTDGKAYTTPVSAGDYVFIAYIEADYYLVALDKDGHQAWSFPE